MFRKTIISLLTLCLVGLAVPVRAAQVDCDATYCFTPEDFSQEESLQGICITDLPQNRGALLLGHRVLRQGDILTTEQVSRMTFSPVRSEIDATLEVGYLPIYENHVDEPATMTLSIRGKEDKAPVAQDNTLETYKNLPNTGKLKVQDPEGENLTYTLVRQPRRGTVEIGADGSFTYTPKKNKVGVDSFTYTAADPAGNVSREATVTVTILKPSQAPQYTDTVGKDCRFAAEWMKHTGIFVGEQVGQTPCFGPEKDVTKGEFVTMLVKTLEIPTEEEITYTGFTEDTPQWLQPYLAAAVRSGLTEPLQQQDAFQADAPITTAEAAAMVMGVVELDMPLPEGNLTRSDAARMLYAAAMIKNQEADILI